MYNISGVKMNNLSLNDNDVVCLRLSIERCQKYLAHLHAVMYMCDPKDLGLDDIMAENARGIMGAINRELSLSSKALEPVEARAYQKN